METCDVIRLKSIIFDFELAVKNVFYKCCPHVEVKGCLVRYGQALFRKFVDLNLRTAFQQDETVRVWFRSFAAIALLLQKDMIEATEYLRLNKPFLYEKEIELFIGYHDKTYGVNRNFPPIIWKKRSAKPHNDVYTCINMFKHEQLLAADERRRNETGTASLKRRRATRIAEETLCRLWHKLENQKIDRVTF
ncbi:unnamed protein product [Rotaria sp. Silwood2]|nr:unnamed protein product [Rotaria sp. Silwood2]CAF4037552.1 unnamed protein product [Rotaria sp. Silwood2]